MKKNPDINRLVKKKKSKIEKNVTDQNHDKSIITSEFNNLTAKNFTGKSA